MTTQHSQSGHNPLRHHDREPRQQVTYPADEAEPAPHPNKHGARPDPPTPQGHGGHRLMMMICCIPMILIAVALVATGAAGSGVIVAALLCTVMMAAMMFMMPAGHGGHGHK